MCQFQLLSGSASIKTIKKENIVIIIIVFFYIYYYHFLNIFIIIIIIIIIITTTIIFIIIRSFRLSASLNREPSAGNASQQGCVEVVKLLLDRGLDEMHRDNYGWTSLHIAAYEGHNEVPSTAASSDTLASHFSQMYNSIVFECSNNNVTAKLT